MLCYIFNKGFMSYIGRFTRELRGNNRVKGRGKDIGQRYRAETRGKSQGQRQEAETRGRNQAVIFCLYCFRLLFNISLCRIRSCDLKAWFFIFINIVFYSLKYRSPCFNEKQEVWYNYCFWFLVSYIIF
jgi:hypothetical protein